MRVFSFRSLCFLFLNRIKNRYDYRLKERKKRWKIHFDKIMCVRRILWYILVKATLNDWKIIYAHLWHKYYAFAYVFFPVCLRVFISSTFVLCNMGTNTLYRFEFGAFRNLTLPHSFSLLSYAFWYGKITINSNLQVFLSST